MNILTDFEAHKRDEDFDRDDAKRHRETCSPAGSCYTAMCCQMDRQDDGTPRHLATCEGYGVRHYCDIHRPEPVCDSCGDTGRVPVWRMGWHGYTEATEKCKDCNTTGGHNA